MGNPLVTVCITTFNNEQHLAETIQSILNQTYKNIEIIILDNCSSDGTPDVYRKFSDKRLKIIRHKKNLGGLGNFNTALTKGKGKYLATFHDDDVYEKTIVAEQVKIFEKHDDVSCVFTSCNIIDETGTLLNPYNLPKQLRNKAFTRDEIIFHILKTMRSPFITPSLMARRSVFKKAGRFRKNYPAVGDVDMNLRLAQTGKAHFIGERLVKYRHTKDQWSIRYTMTYTKPNEMFRFLDKLLIDMDVPRGLRSRYEAHRDWDYTICALNILSKQSVSRQQARTARSYLRKSFSLRRLVHFYREPAQIAITTTMLVLAHLGLGRPMARKINAVRWKRHLT